ncbi:MAG: tail fiber domain-containing protein [Candidatus Binatus sp.]|uniref:tail fiber domain-containing protein n=1 Tax=Candidatus Binatus sp. TaxID=2811406 RepID=UPI002724A35C|nr:tail fiber domain-containing protein [Candidatus Binatus sp.]MDO8433884.1 tail fiber domain-containing protein [Candidatus Binatus sp.]
MNRVWKDAIAITGLILTLAAASSWAGAPPNNDVSDMGNTAGGTGALGSNTSGTNNTSFGAAALGSNTTGIFNTASGFHALFNNISGGDNTATGAQTLSFNTTGSFNTASGHSALFNNISGGDNTASGFQTLFDNTTGANNTATGAEALTFNTTGSLNTATGVGALEFNTTGANNSATGVGALTFNTSGRNNTAQGANTLYNSSTGIQNTASGAQALYNNTTANFNTADGVQALFKNTTGQSNTAIGFQAGFFLTTGSNNIDLGNRGVAADAATIRLGTQGTQTATFIAGIAGSSVTGSDVVVNGSGRLGIIVSSARYKRDIHDMGTSTDALMKLHPVTFIYKGDQQGVRQYGLVAEEVDQVYPELVVHDPDGKVESVRYSMLSSMLLNELQKETRKNQEQADRIARLEANHQRDAAMRIAIEQRLAKLEHTVLAAHRSSKVQTAFNK